MGKTPEQLYEMTLSGLNLIKQAISIHDQDLKLVVANRRFQKMFNLPDQLMMPGSTFREILNYVSQQGEYGPLDDIESFVDEKVELARTFEPHYFERTRSNGTSISVEGNPMSDGGWISVYTDITEAKRQEEFFRTNAESLSDELLQRSEDLAHTNREMEATVTALEAAKQKLTDSREQLNLINAMTPAHIAHVTDNGIYTHSNGKLNSILPQTQKDIVGHKFQDVLGPTIWEHVGPRFKTVLQGNPSTSEFYDATSGRFVRLVMTPDIDQGQVKGCYLLSMDVTDEVSARTALTHARRRALATQLTSGMAHDFSNLLTIIMGQQARLEELESTDPRIARVSGTIKSAARRGGELIESLSRIESPRQFEPVAVAMTKFLDNVERLARAAIGKEVNLNFISNIADTRLALDPGFAQDAILNLVLNASEAQNGKGEITVKFSRITDHLLEILVLDRGPGFSRDALANALTPFYSTKVGKVGSGIGLSAAFDFAKICGGTIRLDNRDHGGASVSLRIPYEAIKAKTSGFILLLDDDDDVRETVRIYLQRAGHAVIEAVSVDEAANLVGIEGLTHVVSDLSVGPRQTGLDLSSLVPDHIPVIIITGLPRSDSLRQRAEEKHLVLSKPLTFETLEDAILKVDLK